MIPSSPSPDLFERYFAEKLWAWVPEIRPSYGGKDATAPEEYRFQAPATALSLGRAVSVADLEAAAVQFGAIRA